MVRSVELVTDEEAEITAESTLPSTNTHTENIPLPTNIPPQDTISSTSTSTSTIPVTQNILLSNSTLSTDTSQISIPNICTISDNTDQWVFGSDSWTSDATVNLIGNWLPTFQLHPPLPSRSVVDNLRSTIRQTSGNIQSAVGFHVPTIRTQATLLHRRLQPPVGTELEAGRRRQDWHAQIRATEAATAAAEAAIAEAAMPVSVRAAIRATSNLPYHSAVPATASIIPPTETTSTTNIPSTVANVTASTPNIPSTVANVNTRKRLRPPRTNTNIASESSQAYTSSTITTSHEIVTPTTAITTSRGTGTGADIIITSN